MGGNRKPPGRSGFNSLYHVYKRTARERGYDFLLTKEDVSFITKMNCYYCGAEPIQEKWAGPGSVEAYVYNGIDRMDNRQGYTLDNVVASCGKCNKMKMRLTLSEFLERIEMIHAKHRR